VGADDSPAPRSKTRVARRQERHRARSTRVGAFAAALLLTTGAVFAGILVLDGSEHRTPTARAQNPVVPFEEPAPPIVVPAPPVTAAPPLPVPEAAPADPYEKVPVVAIGEIDIPKIGLTHTIYEGVSLTVVDHGPGHWPGTPMPGGYGNSVFAGHRTTNTRPFRNLDQLVEGDPILFRTDHGTFTYRVTKTEVVHWDDVWIVDQHAGHTLTLFACHPPGSAEFRYVVFGELVTV
jgi:sortase A